MNTEMNTELAILFVLWGSLIVGVVFFGLFKKTPEASSDE